MIRWSTTRPAVVWAASAGILLAGGIAFFRLPLATKTAVELPKLVVQSSWPGASAEVVETYVTSPIEATVQAVRGVRKTSSESSEGSSRLTIELEPKADIRLARLGILERLELLRNEFPRGVSQPTVSNYVPEELGEAPLLEVTLRGPYTPGALTKVVTDIIAPRIGAVSGVSGVQSSGGTQRGASVTYDAARLRQLGVLPGSLTETIRDSRLVRAIGREVRGPTSAPVLIRDEPSAVEQLLDLPVVASGGRHFAVRDVAVVRIEEDAQGTFFRVNGQAAVSMTIARLPTADAIRTAAAVREVFDRLRPELPPGAILHVEQDESTDLARELRDLVLRGVVAFVLVALVLALTLRRWRAVAVVMLSAAVSIAGTALGLYLLHVPANLLTLAGLGMGIGILVQDGLVVVDRIVLADDNAAGRAAAARRIAPAIIGATLTTVVVLFPFLYLEGDARAAFVPFAAAFALALAWSVLSSLVIVPSLGSHLRAARGGWPRLHRWYARITVRLVRWRWATLTIAAASLGVLGWGFWTKVPRSSFGSWYGERTVLSARLGFPKGSDPAALDRGMHEFEQIVVGQPGVQQVQTRGFPDFAYMQVLFTKDGGASALPYQMQEELTQRALLVGGAEVSVFGKGPGFSAGGSVGSAVAFRVKILGYSYAGVEAIAEDLKRRLLQIPRVREVNTNAGSFYGSEKSYAVTLLPSRSTLAEYGLTATDLASAVSREIRGPVGAQRLAIGGEEIPVTLKVAGARDRDLDDLRDALIPVASGSPVRLRDVASVEEREAIGRISREDQQYVRILSYDFRGPQKLANRTHTAFMKSIAVPAGYTVSDEVFEWQHDESAKGLWLVFGIGIVLVLLTVALVFDSTWAAAMTFLSLPFALGGVAAAFWIAKAAFSREAAVGVILVVGLAVHQTIFLLDGILEQMARRGIGNRTAADVVRAARDRARMIVLVTLTTLASLLPLAVGTDVDSLFGAIALATVGGTIAGTVGAMFVMPALVSRRSRRPSI